MEDGEDGVVVLFFNINRTFFCVCSHPANSLRIRKGYATLAFFVTNHIVTNVTNVT